MQSDQKKQIIRQDVAIAPTVACLLNFISGIIQNKNHDSEQEELNAPLKHALNNFVYNLLASTYIQKHNVGSVDFFTQPPSSAKSQKVQGRKLSQA